MGNNRLISYITSISNATEDDVVDSIVYELEALSNPDKFNKLTLGDAWYEVLGYNPIDYHDVAYMSENYEDLIANAPITIKDNLRNKKSIIIREAIAKRDIVNDAYLTNILCGVIYNETGWIDRDQIVDLDNELLETNSDEYDFDDYDNDEYDDYDESEDDLYEDYPEEDNSGYYE
jgi:hypothetical protein